ncbi:aminoglycoside phosphotransferase family protein [Streptomyces boninensis]|uniref:aminoglycoside phosphotransferase family protein n=1 Tax=Streptomyces boninensis TaxID=2039455 RepID=UPI003B226C25
MVSPSSSPVSVSPVVRSKAERLGAPGREWLARLPAAVRELAARWSLLAVGPALPGGSEGYVARARTAAGDPVVLKVALPGNGDREAAVLRRAAGRGYARLLAHDPARHALLLEALGAPLAELGAPAERQIDVLCATLRQAWRVEPGPGDVLEGKATGLGELVTELWEELGRPCPEGVFRRALGYARRRAAGDTPERAVLVHGDPHPGNALQRWGGAGVGGVVAGEYAFVDPDGFRCDPAYDLGVVLRDWCPELRAAPDPGALARRYCARLAAGGGADAAAVWEWGYLERVSTGLYLLAHGESEQAGPFLETAEILLTTEPPSS